MPPGAWIAPYWSPTASTSDAGLGEETRRPTTNLAEALHGRGRSVVSDAQVRERLQGDVHDAARGGRRPAERAAEADRLAGHDAQDGVAGVHRVGVHHPGHGLLVGADVGRGDVVRGTDQRHDLRGVAPGDALELGLRVVARIDDHATLGAAVRDVEQRALPRHPHRQRADLVEVDVRAVAQPALCRPAGVVVLHPVAGDDLHAAVVAAQRDADRELATRGGEQVVHALVVAEHLDGVGELRAGVIQRGSRRRGGVESVGHRISLKTSVRMSSASVSRSSPIASGGRKRSTLPNVPQVRTMTPRWCAASATALARSGPAHRCRSGPVRRRSSLRGRGRRRCGRRRPAGVQPILHEPLDLRGPPTRSSASMVSMVASAAAQATGLPP